MMRVFRLAGITLLLAVVVLQVGREIWVRVETAKVMRQRNLSLKVFQDAMNIAIVVQANDEELERAGKPSIWPADLGMKDSWEYIRFLKSKGYIEFLPKTPPGSLQIGNVSRDSSGNTIFVMSTGTMLDVHTMIHIIGGVPNYSKGFIAFRKNGKGQFYRDAERSNHDRIGEEPILSPPFLSSK